MITPRENMLRTIRCEDAEWMPVFIYVDSFNSPSPDSLPDDLAAMFRERIGDWNRRWELCISLSEYLGVDEYMLNAPAPVRTGHTGAVEERRWSGEGCEYRVIGTPSGELRQVSRSGYVVERMVKGPSDLGPFLQYVDSWTCEPDPVRIAQIRSMRERIGDRGMIWFFGEGTPLGMMYRIYADVAGLIYMLADMPGDMAALFGRMEEKYRQALALMLESAPGIDLYVGIDDTSTTLISPAMFGRYDAAVTDGRADLAHRFGRYYMHHSCGLIRDLLPEYRRTRMDGVHAFTVPPIGDVGYGRGRELLGEGICICGNFQTGLNFPDRKTHEETVARRCEDARRAGHIMLYSAPPNSLHGVDFMRTGLDVARKYQKY